MTPEKLEAARLLLLGLPEDANPSDALYAHWFHETGQRQLRYPLASAYHAASLHAAAFDTGWTVARTGLPGRAAQVEVTKGDRTRFVAPPDVTPVSERAVTFAPGMDVAVNPMETTVMNGFWHLFSPGWQEAPPPVPRKRFYFNTSRGEETAFIRAATQMLSAAETWSLKILCGEAPEGRCDPCVLYLPGGASATDPWIADLLDSVEPFLAPVAVPGAAPIREGVAEAPDTDDTKSFGQRLCGVLAAIPPDMPDWVEEARERLIAIGAAP